MATVERNGTCIYWNGASGWIKLDGVEEMSTAQSNDVMVLQSGVASGPLVQGATVNFDIDDATPWLATNLAVV